MKQFYKKISSVCMAFLCVAALLIGCSSTAWAADEIDDSVKTQLASTAKQLTEAIIAMSEDDLKGYMESDDAFTQNAATAWDGSREELGEKKGDIDEKEITVEYSDDQYTVVVPVSFEKNKADFTYVIDKTGAPTSLAVDVQYTLAQNMEKAAMNTLMGLGTVFVILVFLIFVISLFKYIPGLVEGKKKESKPAPAAAAPAPVAAPVAEPAVEDVTDDGELIAVIAAAIAASEGKTSTDGFVVRSIRKINRRKR
nr:OadG family transporter subunit [uncultured Blautia sp.]